MDRITDLRAAEQRVREASYAAFGEEVDALEHTLGFTHAVIASVDELSLDQTFLRALLVSRALGSLRCGWLSAAAGYRTQALTLARAAFEDYATAAWVAKRPEDAELWLWEIVDDAAKPDRRPPRFTSMFEELGQEDEGFSSALKRVYGHLSEAAHPRAPGLQWNVQWSPGSQGAKHSADLLPVFDESSTASCLHHLLMIAGLILGVVAELYLGEDGDKPKDSDEFVAELQRHRDRLLRADEQLAPLIPTEADAGPQ